jgi:hypothetical protein
MSAASVIEIRVLALWPWINRSPQREQELRKIMKFPRRHNYIEHNVGIETRWNSTECLTTTG